MMGEHSIVSLVLHASLIVQFVLLLLLGASVVSWAIILRKRRVLGEARSTTDEFEERFWSGVDLAVLYKALDATANTGMSAIFVSGFREFSRLRHQVGISGAHLLEGSRRAMRVAQLKEFAPDNVRLVGDRLLTTGMIDDEKACGGAPKKPEDIQCPRGWVVDAVDPKTMRITEVTRGPAAPPYTGTATAIPVGNDIWLSSFTADRVAYRSMTSK